MKVNKVEILAPAGSFEALKAAIKAGANAIYLGGQKYSARSKAYNFSKEDLKEAVIYAHLRKVRLYVTTNILIDDREMLDAIKFVKYLRDIGVDGVIVQDLGFSYLVRKNFKDIEVHASTQMAVNNFYGAKTIESFGFERLVLARETELQEINLIKEKTSLEVEAFIHGALCVCFSGECLMSSMIGGRSGNRGDCAQPCRKKYEILDLNLNSLSDKAYFLSTKDLNSIANLDDLINRGVDSLKIEGRMKKPEYVYQIVSSYKKRIEERLTKKDEDNIEQIFNRGFTKGIHYGDFGRSFISYDRPDNRGRLIGEVGEKVKNGFILKLNENIEIGDGIEFYKDGRSSGLKSNFFAEKNSNYIFETKRNILNSKIYKTYSKELNDSISDKLNEEKKYREISMTCNLYLGKKPELLINFENKELKVYLEQKIVQAKNKALTKEQVEKSLSKLGDTVYRLETLKINIEDNIFMSLASLNELRRMGINKLNDLLENKNIKPRVINENDLFIKRKLIRKNQNLNVFVYNLGDLRKVNRDLASKIYFPVDKLNQETIDYLLENKIKISAVFKKFQNSKELENSFNLVKSNLSIINEVLLNNLSQIYIFKDMSISKVADIGLNSFNSYTVKYLLELGFNRVVLSPELNYSQIKKIGKDYGDLVEVICHGLIAVMTMPHCPMSIELNCKNSNNCEFCKYSKGFFLKDSYGERFLVERDSGVSEVFNSHPIMLEEKVKDLSKVGICNFRLNLRESIGESLKFYKDILKNDTNEKRKTFIREELINKYGAVSYGHFNRGIIND
ncbi:MAG: DUF3656 domain-containing U32 family peptidase [Peptoniphilaceae bacterium]